MSARQQFCTFYLDGAAYGVEVHKVQEVLRWQQTTPVPLAPPTIGGLLNLRGQIVTAIDLRHRLAMPPRPEGCEPMNVVVRTAEGAVSLLVDEIGDVVEVGEESFELPPDTLSEIAKQMTSGVYKLKDRLLLVLRMEKAVEVSGTTLAAA
jgi:purine-binding chemotaxis protein CheW